MRGAASLQRFPKIDQVLLGVVGGVVGLVDVVDAVDVGLAVGVVEELE